MNDLTKVAREIVSYYSSADWNGFKSILTPDALYNEYASMLVNSGRTLYEVQQILGHSDPSVTQRYSHLSASALQAAANSASLKITQAGGTS